MKFSFSVFIPATKSTVDVHLKPHVLNLDRISKLLPDPIPLTLDIDILSPLPSSHGLKQRMVHQPFHGVLPPLLLGLVLPDPHLRVASGTVDDEQRTTRRHGVGEFEQQCGRAGDARAEQLVQRETDGDQLGMAQGALQGLGLPGQDVLLLQREGELVPVDEGVVVRPRGGACMCR